MYDNSSSSKQMSKQTNSISALGLIPNQKSINKPSSVDYALISGFVFKYLPIDIAFNCQIIIILIF